VKYLIQYIGQSSWLRCRFLSSNMLLSFETRAPELLFWCLTEDTTSYILLAGPVWEIKHPVKQIKNRSKIECLRNTSGGLKQISTRLSPARLTHWRMEVFSPGKRYGNEAGKDEAIIAAIILRTNSAEQCARQ